MDHSTRTPARMPIDASRQHVRQTIAIGICGAIGGASVLEAAAAIWLHPAASIIQPTADPLALAGAVLGAGFTLLLRGRIGVFLAPVVPASESTEVVLVTDAVTNGPLAWQSVPLLVPMTAPSSLSTTPDNARALHIQAQPYCPLSRERTARRTVRPTGRRTQAPHHIPAQ